MTECPNAASHTPLPQSYIGRQEWAAAMQRQGSRQGKCPGCRRWEIWRGINAPLPPERYERGCLMI